MLDSVRLRAELYFIHRALCRAIPAHHPSMLEKLRSETQGTTATLLSLTLYADCLRVIYTAASVLAISDNVLDKLSDVIKIAARHYTGAHRSQYGALSLIDLASTKDFLEYYRVDSRPFGYDATDRWYGLTLCQQASAQEPQILLRYARLMRWLIEAACQASGVSLAHPHHHAKISQITELRHALSTAFPEPIEDEDRLKVFLSEARVFTPIDLALSVPEHDPFDVELPEHEAARARFRNLVEQATSDHGPTTSGRTLLIIGDSGAGKTHLLRSFWSYVQEYGRGFVAYAQLYLHVDDYTAYLLGYIVDSLAAARSGSSGEQTGLHELANAMVKLKAAALADQAEQLAQMRGQPRAAIDAQINPMVDVLLNHPDLATFDPDLLRVLLYTLCGERSAIPRIRKYLRCEPMNDYDRLQIGNVTPRMAKEDPKAMLRSLARLAYVTQRAVLVLMVDQAELSGVDSALATAVFQRAVDALLGIVSEVPSAIAVIACLSNLYDNPASVLGQSTLDRLEKDPPPVRFSSNRSFAEIEAIVGRRLAWLYAEAGAVYRADQPVYPIPEAELRKFVNRKPRAILHWCQQFHEQCVASGTIISDDGPPLPPPIDQIAEAWEQATQKLNIEVSKDTQEALALAEIAARAVAAETGMSLTQSINENDVMHLQLSMGALQAELVIAVTNRGSQAGAFGKQIKALRRAARDGIAVALRTVAFPKGEVARMTIEALTGAGGRAIYFDRVTARALMAYRLFQPAFDPEHIDAWRRRDRPISRL